MSTPIQVGDKVRWYTRRNQGSSIEFKSFTGTVDEIKPTEGVAVVRPEGASRRKSVQLISLELVDKNPFHIFDAAAKSMGIAKSDDQPRLIDAD
jgi:hypothetical protein